MIYCSFNGTDLSTLTNILVDSVETEPIAKKVVTSYKLARNDGRVITNAQYEGKEIVVTGQIIADDQATMRNNRNSLINIISSGINKTLLVNIYDTIQQFTATAEEPIFSDSTGGFTRFTIKFMCRDAFGIDQNLQFLLNSTGQTTTPNTQSLSTIGGNYDAAPILEVYVNAVTGGTSKYIQLTNPATSKSIKITRTWAAGELLVVDPEAKTVKVNNVDVDFLGGFLEWATGASGQLKYEDSFSTRTVQIRAKYHKRYL